MFFVEFEMENLIAGDGKKVGLGISGQKHLGSLFLSLLTFARSFVTVSRDLVMQGKH